MYVFRKRSGFIAAAAVAAAAAGLLGAAAAPSADTLRLNSTHPFDVRLTAKDQHHGGASVTGNAIPQNDVFGYFSFPPPTGSLDNPEVFVKLLDGTTINGQYWVFYGHVTDLEYTLSVTEVATGRAKSYHKNPGTEAGGFDTSGFNLTATPATTATPTPSATPTPTPPAGSVRIDVSAAQFAYSPGTLTPINVTAGVPTTLHFTAADVAHGFSGIPELGIAGSSYIAPAGDDYYGVPGTPAVDYTVTFTAPILTRGQVYDFWCTAPGPQGCGSGHVGMRGTLRVN